MTRINLLSEDLVNKIAAGEVIERPSSVVKELIENSLDAKATAVTVEITGSGKGLIKVTDNGKGMSEEEAKRSILRHATSKISTAEDLFAIQTLGFRGEALASIAAVSQLSIITKPKDKISGFNLVVERGVIISSGIIAAEQGTVVEVRNLFFNTPARKKFLKTDAVELRHIIEVVTQYALINKDVSFKLLHEKHQLLHSPAVEDMRSNIASIYGTALARDMLEVDYQNELVKINGYIAKPDHARNDKSQQALFVNGRWVRNQVISKKVCDAFHSLLFIHKHPVFVLHLEIEPANVDVNIHPQKSEIKIEQIKEVGSIVTAAIRETLQVNKIIPVVDVDFEQQLSLKEAGVGKKSEVERDRGEMEDGNKTEYGKEMEEKVKYSFEPGKQAVFQVKETAAAAGSDSSYSSHQYIPGSSISDEYTTPEGDVLAFEQQTTSELAGEAGESELQELSEPVRKSRMVEKLPAMKILGQIHKTFFVAETLGGVLFIDQHAAHERVLYEQFMNQYIGKDVEVQQLLQSELLEFSPAETVLVNEHRDILEKFGFVLEDFGQNTFVIKTIPLLFGRLQPKEIIYEVLSMLRDGRQKLTEAKEQIVTRMACRAAVMAGDVLTIREMEKILNQLSKTDFPYTCPHGRPTIIKTTADELEKKFKRK